MPNINIDGQIIPEPTEFIQPQLTGIITTYELAEEPDGHFFWKATLTHVIHGETVERIQQIIDAHRKTDTFFAGSFKGKWNGIILKNSEFQIIR